MNDDKEKPYTMNFTVKMDTAPAEAALDGLSKKLAESMASLEGLKSAQGELAKKKPWHDRFNRPGLAFDLFVLISIALLFLRGR